MKDYKLSDIKCICEKYLHKTKKHRNCQGCPFLRENGNCDWEIVGRSVPCHWIIEEGED